MPRATVLLCFAPSHLLPRRALFELRDRHGSLLGVLDHRPPGTHPWVFYPRLPGESPSRFPSLPTAARILGAYADR